MLTTILLKIIVTVIGWIIWLLSFLGDPTLPEFIYTAFENSGNYLGYLNFLFPTFLSSFFAIIALQITVLTFWIVYVTIRWAYSKIPTIS